MRRLSRDRTLRHNYPSEMDFQLGQRDVKRLVSYMLTLKTSDYKRPPD
jgi:hypothetical protein